MLLGEKKMSQKIAWAGAKACRKVCALSSFPIVRDVGLGGHALACSAGLKAT